MQTRRQLLRQAAAATGSALVCGVLPETIAQTLPIDAAPGDPVLPTAD